MSRNFTVGARMAKGETLEEVKASTNSIAEGVFTAWSIHQMSVKLGLDMPICSAVYSVLYENVPFLTVLKALQKRPLRGERDEEEEE
ncbi:hypothetical protein SARC_12092 [Sphaeroforma arctica JP610]|uniref:Glycerol-3-phosphate dehydrogenase NAD-dependent C-terminal domain-containing protein n=1 Tax=Sphaeroforma arctica JP610 TaxID=667725 RepID=A0A0L0FF46_9EUKA|nr:hypothetical protein SARC_12092 [Sphaeroforma arctica JP610]KNC75380.1 hypothetical protein SARC_12092 [Sphaeroforma arctica JP610]|eukprot:XP_014149282.1 hypothetical protein SARC_12092 [Sphaeroforma arctica JP610]